MHCRPFVFNCREAELFLERLKMSNKNHFIFNSYRIPLSILLIIFASISCQTGKTGEMIAENSKSFENRFFTLDFESTDYDMKAIEKQFFTTFPHNDPTQGDVVYDRKQWQNDDMVTFENNDGLYLYIKERDDSSRFDSCRLTSKAYYNLSAEKPKILFVFKGKLPSGKAIWPAWWLNGSIQDNWTYRKSVYERTDSTLDDFSGKGNFYDTQSAVNNTDWPASGELDIIENINGEKVIHNTLHTCPQMCDSEWNDDGQIINCANAKSTDVNSGCSGKAYEIDSPEGTFACLWEKDQIKFYYWNSAEKVRFEGGPLSEDPQPQLWDLKNLKNKVQLLETDVPCESSVHQQWQCASCESSNHCSFRNMKMIFNITLCGVWAGNKFDDTPNAFNNCKEYIFDEGRSLINNQYLKIEYVSVSEIKD